MLWNCQSNSSLIEYVAAALGWRKSNEKKKKNCVGAVENTHTFWSLEKRMNFSEIYSSHQKVNSLPTGSFDRKRKRRVLLNLVRRRIDLRKTQFQPFISFRFLVFFSTGLSPIGSIWESDGFDLKRRPLRRQAQPQQLNSGAVENFPLLVRPSHISHKSLNFLINLNFSHKTFLLSSPLASRSLGVSNSIRNSTWWD